MCVRLHCRHALLPSALRSMWLESWGWLWAVQSAIRRAVHRTGSIVVFEVFY
jgi:hypothetical protein